ncbi:DUF6783 domain-containing protein [uncultured Robinsoniella sp.]|uniref:DUF6783 domain-containing protein n=1 Tax=uncultured Robinsoniella sp. TaxID=904190 RepID=UPI00374EC8B3
MKNHSFHLYTPLCSRFPPESGYIACYASLFWYKSSTKCYIHLSESNFKTRFDIELNSLL